MSQPGDLWLLGNHRVLCGDARSLKDVETVLANGLEDMVFTDPPYNVDYTQTSSHADRSGRKITNTASG